MDTIGSAETTSVIIDLQKAKANLSRMAGKIRNCGCFLRLHVKTHKIPEFAHQALQYGACGITCAKVSEAEVMAENGLRDIFIAYPLVGDFRIRRALALNRKIRLILSVDSLDGALALSSAAQREGDVFEVWLEVATGLHRTGVKYGAAFQLARRMQACPGFASRAFSPSGISCWMARLRLTAKPPGNRKASCLQNWPVCFAKKA